MILEDFNLICESFRSFSFVNVPLKCNKAALVLASVAKDKGETYSWFEECLSFLFPIAHHVILSIKSTINSSIKKCVYICGIISGFNSNSIDKKY